MILSPRLRSGSKPVVRGGLGKQTLLERLFPPWPMKSLSPRTVGWSLAVLFCLAVWITFFIILFR